MTEAGNLKSQGQLAKAAGVSRSTIQNWMRRADFPKPGKDGVYDEAAWLTYAAARQSERIACTRGRDADLKREKLRAQVALLTEQARRAKVEAEHAEIDLGCRRGELVPIEEHKAAVLSVQRLMMTWWNNAIENVATKRKDAKLLKVLREAGQKAGAEIMEAT